MRHALPIAIQLADQNEPSLDSIWLDAVEPRLPEHRVDLKQPSRIFLIFGRIHYQAMHMLLFDS